MAYKEKTALYDRLLEILRLKNSQLLAEWLLSLPSEDEELVGYWLGELIMEMHNARRNLPVSEAPYKTQLDALADYLNKSTH